MDGLMIENGILQKYEGTAKRLSLPAEVHSIAERAFEKSALEEIVMPHSLREIGHGAFWYCKDLKEVILPDTVEAVGEGLFVGCASLERVTLPLSMTYLPEDTFRGCKSLTSVSLPEDMTYLADSALEGCASLKEITLPKGVVSVGMKAFAGCAKLEKISLPEGLLRIKLDAFSGCEGLSSLTLPASLGSLESAFDGCVSLKKLRFLRKERFHADIGIFDGSPSPLDVEFGGTSADFEASVAPSYGELYHVTMGDFARGYRYPMFHRALGKDFECRVLCLGDGKSLTLHGAPYDQVEGPF